MSDALPAGSDEGGQSPRPALNSTFAPATTGSQGEQNPPPDQSTAAKIEGQMG
jgi:hypothetical protein